VIGKNIILLLEKVDRRQPFSDPLSLSIGGRNRKLGLGEKSTGLQANCIWLSAERTELAKDLGLDGVGITIESQSCMRTAALWYTENITRPLLSPGSAILKYLAIYRASFEQLNPPLRFVLG